eukprot:CAMPEP_0178456118 /NCGR_PEP_ID=MMETSP0689_2-20121128/46291_1 /TAXON_ID=160604 /ORGANISM="Amphidinium massartii, Strain CS-259" /LENGTH=62 /DNA_ID=CAMNT_0020082237 /DNA_START=8 /DNA_END=192 /DNA_ORIENTATION=-
MASSAATATMSTAARIERIAEALLARPDAIKVVETVLQGMGALGDPEQVTPQAQEETKAAGG